MNKRLAVVAAAFGLMGAVIPAVGAQAGEIVVDDPTRPNCQYVVGWYANPQNIGGTNAYTYGQCSG